MNYCLPKSIGIVVVPCKGKLAPPEIKVISEINNFLGITEDQLKSQCVRRDLCDARHIIFRIVRIIDATKTVKYLAWLMNRHYTSIVASLQVSEGLLKYDPVFKEKFSRVAGIMFCRPVNYKVWRTI